MRDVFILSAKRTPIGSFGGVFSGVEATTLGSVAIKSALETAGVEPDQVEEVLLGNVCSANLGQAPARQAALGAGIPDTVPCTTVNKVCSSGAKTVMQAALSIMAGQNDLVVAGGMENMSRIPFYSPSTRWGSKYGSVTLEDGLERDGLLDAYQQVPMGVFADETAEDYKISREEQDRYTVQSYERAASAWEAGLYHSEIAPVMVPQRKSDPIAISHDEEYKKVNFDKIPSLRPVFTKEGTVTAANASKINDGASALVLASGEYVEKNGLTPIARIRGFADAAQNPERFTTAPTIAAPLALQKAGVDKDEIDLWEVNEAFAVVALAFCKEMKLSEDIVNVNGGAVALGHPLGASGARILTTLVHALVNHDKRLGCMAICNGGGGASSIVIERV